MVREGRVHIASATRAAFGSDYFINVFEPGAQVAQGSAGTVATVRAGHAIEAGDYVMVATSSSVDSDRYRLVSSVTSTTVVLTQPLSLAAGEFLINLGADSGGGGPFYDGSGVTVYADMAYTLPYQLATLTADSTGRYRYFHKGIARWELVRTSTGTPIALYIDTDNPGDEDQVSYGIRYAHLFATSGTGTEDDPWVTSGSNPVQAAIDDLPVTGGSIYRIPGHYDLGSADPAVTIPILDSATDTRSYQIIGAGQDLVFDHYSGSGSAYRLPQVNTGVLGESWQSNRNVFRGFSIMQDGTARTGNAFYLSYGSHNLFEDLGIGCLRANLSAGEPDTGFEYGIRFEGPASDEVADFNTFRGINAFGNTLGIYMQNQCDNAKFYDCHFEPRQDAGVAQNGLALGNGQGFTIHGCHFNYFNFDADSYAIRLNTVVQGVDIAGCYFEGNSNDVYLYADGHQKGIHIHGNFSTGGSTTTHVGVRAGIDGGTFTIKGLVIEGNSFNGLSTSEIGIRLGTECKGYQLIGNTYDITGGGTEVSISAGAQGIRLEPTASSTSYPRIQLTDSDQDQGHIALLTDKAGTAFSPRLYFIPSTAVLHVPGNAFSLSADSSGTLSGKDNSGTTIFQISQLGHVVVSGQLRRSVSAAVSASTTHTQAGGTALTADINNVSTCANADDAVTLPTAVAGMTVVVMNNGAQNLRIWPASGDNLGTGVDTVRGALAAGSNVRFTSYDATNWEEI